MASVLTSASPLGGTAAAVPPSGRRVLLCPPRHFDVTYEINPWMGTTLRSGAAVDRAVARAQWAQLLDALEAAGHQVDLVEPAPDLPDMVFAANAATVVDGTVLLARFRHPQRRPEEDRYRAWFEAHGFDRIHQARHPNEGEGDLLLAGDVLLAGWGFRTSREAHAEAAATFDREVVGLRLVDPAYYHLDTALAVVGSTIAWYPPAFDAASGDELRHRFPDAIEARPEEAAVLGLNLFADRAHAVVPAGAPRLAAALAERGLSVMPVDLSELRKAGGSVKCCTLELRT